MFQQYRKTLLPVQSLILLMGVTGIFFMQMLPLAVIFGVVLPMEGAAFIGAAWSYRLKRKVIPHNERNGIL